MFQLFKRVFFLMLFSSLALPAWAQNNYPDRAITLVVPFAPGGNTDNMARLTAEWLTSDLGKAVVVENRAGAGGVIATDYVARAKSDGYTLLFGTVTQLSTAQYTNKIRYDAEKDFVAISNVGGNPYVIAARPDAPFNTWPELVEYAKTHELSCGHAGVGGLTHLSAAVVLDQAKIKALMIPYRGGAPALMAVAAGEIDFYSGNLSEVLPYVGTDRVKLLGVTSPKELSILPNVPAMTDYFGNDFSVETWNGLVGPSAMPKAAVDKLIESMKRAHADPSFKKRLESLGVTAINETGDVFKERIRSDSKRWKPIIEAAGIVPQ